MLAVSVVNVIKLFGMAIKEHLVDHGSNIVAAAAGRQSSNGLVESHWKIMVHMARAYLTEKQMPRLCWFYAVSHSARMMNTFPGKFGGKLASPFLLVHGVGHDERTWFHLFSVCYFHCEREGDISRSHCQAHTMDGIAIGCSPTSNAMLVYSPRTKRYYEPDSYRLDPYRLPSSVYPDLRYDGGLFCSLVRDGGAPMEELYPPGTRVERLDPTSKLLLAGTVMDIPLSTDVLGFPSYLILFDNGTSASIPLTEMPSMIPAPPVPISDMAESRSEHSHLLPPFLSINSRITYEHDGTYHKGFLFRKACLGEYRALREKGAPKAIPTMCVLTIKKDEQLLPLRAKSRIVFLGNRETRDWSKSDRFAPVLRFDSLRFLVSLAVQHR